MVSPSTVLLVDDDSDTRVIYGRILTRAGYRVVEAATGRDAIATAGLMQPEIVVLDLGLPDMDGLDVARALRASSTTSAARIIIFTAYVSGADQAEARAAGCDLYLSKPIPPRDLVTLIQQLASTTLRPPAEAPVAPASELHRSQPGHPTAA
jgi:CheY-like chemotaxis protein